MLSQTVEYALRAVVCLAGAPEGRLTTPQIAAETQVPPGYLSKLLQALGRAGVVASQRGLGGGFTLGRPAEELSVLDVVNAVDPLRRIAACPLGKREHQLHLCPLHRRLDAAIASVEAAFAATTIAEIIAENRPGDAFPEFGGEREPCPGRDSNPHSLATTGS